MVFFSDFNNALKYFDMILFRKQRFSNFCSEKDTQAIQCSDFVVVHIELMRYLRKLCCTGSTESSNWSSMFDCGNKTSMCLLHKVSTKLRLLLIDLTLPIMYRILFYSSEKPYGLVYMLDISKNNRANYKFQGSENHRDGFRAKLQFVLWNSVFEKLWYHAYFKKHLCQS